MSEGEKRREHRRRVLKRGTIIVDLNTSEIACVVCNQHDQCAELSLSAEIVLPGAFILYVPVDQKAYSCLLRWRSRERAGVAFVGTGPKPRLHYG